MQATKAAILDQKFESGKNIAKNTKLMFDAKSNDGFLVKEWKVNGQSITGNTKYKVTEILSNGKKVGERLTVAELTEKLDVEVAFSSDSHKITFSSGEGGELTAALKDGGAVTTRTEDCGRRKCDVHGCADHRYVGSTLDGGRQAVLLAGYDRFVP